MGTTIITLQSGLTEEELRRVLNGIEEELAGLGIPQKTREGETITIEEEVPKTVRNRIYMLPRVKGVTVS